MSTTMDSDPVAPVSDKKTAPSPWFQFVARVRTLTGLTQPDAMRLAGELRAEKAIDAWMDAEVSPRGVAWIRKNYLVMTPDMLRDKIDAIAAIAEKKKEVAAMEAEVMAFVASVSSKGCPALMAAATDLQIYYATTIPKQFTDASEELFTSASQEDAYATVMDATESIREKMKEIQTMELSLQKEAEKAAAKASKEEEKAAAKAAKEAEKAAAKIEKVSSKKDDKKEDKKDDKKVGSKKDDKKEDKTEDKKVEQKKEKGSPPASLIPPPLPPTGGAGTADSEETAAADDSRRKGIPKHIKTLVWNKYIGAAVNSTKCLSCREELISIRSFHCGHVIAEAKGGDSTINNLRPICAPCNSSMGTMSMNEFTKTYFGWEV